MRMARTSARAAASRPAGIGVIAGIVKKPCAAAGMMPLQNLQLFGFGGIGHANLHQEAVELRFGQWIGAFEVDRVLRRENGEPAGQRTTGAVTRHLALFHALKQRRLGARGHAVDFVHQKQVSEHRSRMESERIGAGPQNCGAEDVGGHQVGSGLHALETESEQPAEGLDHQGLCNTRHTFKQRVPLAQTRRSALLQ